jgi:hypothetical protein
LFSRFADPLPPLAIADPRAFESHWILKAPVYLNSELTEKLQVWQWLISARVSEFSQLRPNYCGREELSELL